MVSLLLHVFHREFGFQVPTMERSGNENGGRRRAIATYLVPCYYLLICIFLLAMAMEDTPVQHMESPSTDQVFESLLAAGYAEMAAILRHADAAGFDLATCRNVTIFAPPDLALLPVVGSPALPHHVLCHVAAQRLSYGDLVNKTSSDRIPSLALGHPIVVTTGPLTNQGTGKYVVLNGRARVVSPDLYGDANLIVHGIDRVLDNERDEVISNLVRRKAKKAKKQHKKRHKRSARTRPRMACACRRHHNMIPHSPLVVSSRPLLEDLHMLRGSNRRRGAYSNSNESRIMRRATEVVGSIPALDYVTVNDTTAATPKFGTPNYKISEGLMDMSPSGLEWLPFEDDIIVKDEDED